MAFGSFDEALVILHRIVNHITEHKSLPHHAKTERLHALNGAIEAIQSAWDREQELYSRWFAEQDLDAGYFEQDNSETYAKAKYGR